MKLGVENMPQASASRSLDTDVQALSLGVELIDAVVDKTAFRNHGRAPFDQWKCWTDNCKEARQSIDPCYKKRNLSVETACCPFGD